MISIIIPTYNEERYLPRLLNCIKKQSYKDYEIIVADANSRDKTRLIAKKYGCRIVKGGIPSVGRNNGAKMAKGDIVVFLDADTQLDKNFIQNAMTEAKKRNFSIASCHLMPLSENIIDKIFFNIFNIWASAMQFFYPNASGAMILCKREIYKKVGGFDETIKFAEDMDYVKRCAKIGKFGILKSVAINVSMRRFEKEGRLIMGLKLLLAGVHRIFLGEIRSNIFNYKLRYKK